MVFTATFNNPKYNFSGGGSGTSAIVPVKVFSTGQTFDTISAITLFVETDVMSLYDLETNANNPAQINATLNLKRGAIDWFIGYLNDKPLFRSFEEGNFLQITCLSPEGILARAFCPKDGSYKWVMETTSQLVTELPLLPSSTYGSFKGDTLWPDPGNVIGAKAFNHDDVSNSDLLEVDIGVGTYAISSVTTGTKTFSTLANVPDEFTVGLRFKVSGSTGNDNPATSDGRYSVVSATWTGAQTNIVVNEVIPSAVSDGNIVNDVIILGSDNQGFTPRGWAKIDGVSDEWVNFDGYDNSDADGNYRLRNVARGELGTSAIAHLATVEVFEKIPKQIAPSRVKLEHDASGSPVEWKELRTGHDYGIRDDIGLFYLPGTATGSHRATYKIYDEDEILGTYAITAVSSGAGGWFEISDNRPDDFPTNHIFDVKFSTGNDGEYTVDTAVWTGSATRITVDETVPSAVADGFVVNTRVLTLPDIVTVLCTGDVDLGGAGFSDSDLDFDAIGIRINRYEYDPAKKGDYAWDAILELIKDLSLNDIVKFWFKHADGVFRLTILVPTAKHFSVPWVERIETERGLEDLVSGVRLAWKEDQNLNALSSVYSTHQEATGTGNSPDTYRRVTAGGESWNPDVSTFTESTSAGNFGMDMTVDGKPETKLMAIFSHNPTGDFIHSTYWFGSGDSPPIGNLEQFEIAINRYRTVNPSWQPFSNQDKEIVLRLEGCDDYVVSTDTGTWRDVGVTIRGKPLVDGKYTPGKATSFANPRVNAIRIVWEFMSGPKTPTSYWAAIHYIKAIIDTTKYVYIQLTDDITKIGDPLFIYAPDSFEKLRGGIGSSGSAGAPRSIPIKIGAASEGAAISVGRTTLLTKLRNLEMRRYQYSGPLPIKPELGLDVGIDEDADGTDDYIGKVWEYSVSVGSDGIVTTAAVKDPDAAVIT